MDTVAPPTIPDIAFMTAEEINPPDVDPMGLLDRGYEPVDLGAIKDYANTMYALVGSSRSYHELGALCMVATAIQHRWLPMTWAINSKLRPNLFGCILGRSSFDHKSTALSKVRETMPFGFMPNAYALPGMFTEEGLYKELGEHPMGLIVRDEVGMLFASRNRKYTEFVIPFLTDAYGGQLHAKRLSSASYMSKEVALTLFGATTYSEFARVTTEADWDSGWLVRWIFVVPDPDYNPTMRTRWPTVADKDNLESFQRMLQQLNIKNANAMTADDDALSFLEDWRVNLINEAMATSDRHERVDAIIERYATYAYKFAMILCAARGDGERIRLPEAQDGTRLAENFMTNVFHLYQYQKDHRLTGSQLQKALAILNKHPEGLTRREVAQLMHLNTAMRDEIFNHLLALGAVSETVTGKTTTYMALQSKLPTARINLNGA